MLREVGDDFSDMFNHFVAHGSAANNSCPREITANFWRRRISVCLQSGVANAINTRIHRLAAQTPTDPQAAQEGESFYPGLIEEQAEAYRDGLPEGTKRHYGCRGEEATSQQRPRGQESKQPEGKERGPPMQRCEKFL